MAKDKLVGFFMDETQKAELTAAARKRGISVSELSRQFIVKGMMQEVQKGLPTMADLGSEQALMSYLSLRFGFNQLVATEVTEFFKHLAKTAPDPELVAATKRFLETDDEEPPVFETTVQMKSVLFACGFDSSTFEALKHVIAPLVQKGMTDAPA